MNNPFIKTISRGSNKYSASHWRPLGSEQIIFTYVASFKVQPWCLVIERTQKVNQVGGVKTLQITCPDRATWEKMILLPRAWLEERKTSTLPTSDVSVLTCSTMQMKPLKPKCWVQHVGSFILIFLPRYRPVFHAFLS